MIDIEKLTFDEKGLLPAIVQEENGQVLMLAYMNKESLAKTIETKTTWFWSRSRQELWNKGATSGNMQQVKDNLATYQEAKPLNQQEMELVLSVADDMIRRTTVPCTACHYCVSHCPKHLPIPDLLKLYNEAMVAGSGAFISSMWLASLPAEHQPSACVACHSCEKVCPQQIHIPDALADFARRMGK